MKCNNYQSKEIENNYVWNDCEDFELNENKIAYKEKIKLKKLYQKIGKIAKRFMPTNIKGVNKEVVYDQMMMMCLPIINEIDKLEKNL